MRYIYQGTFRAYNELVSSGTVTVYLAGTTTLATIYGASSGGTADADSAVTTDSAGGFKFYVDEADYMPDQLFDITLSKTGYTEKTYSNISIFPSRTPNIATTAVSYSMLLSDDVINCTATATITPLTASTCTGKEVEIRNSGSGTVTISGTISGITNPTLAQYQCLTIRSDGTVWYEVRPKISVSSTDATNVTTSINSHAITDIFESNGTTVKNATAATTATNAVNVTTNINGHAITDIFETGGVIAKNATTATNLSIGSQAQGDIIYYSGSAWARLGAGTSGNFLKTQGAGANPTWAAATSTKIAGDIVQVVSTTKTDTFTMTSTTLADITGLAVAVTPTSATNKVLITVTIQYSFNGAGGATANFQLFRDTTAICLGDAAGSRSRYSASGAANSADVMDAVSFSFLDSPSTTSATTYKVQANGSSASVLHINYSVTDTDNAAFSRTVSTITVMEVQV